ncbi:hypothetical protein [Natronoglomus mannanivorans]|uniref:Uncharacterized protein n=1 Tax=Natronoglomus mannanivorans TaxID=2979990 RepID=A0AAP2Z304_9EURY|nr:hypothetical protein [Halobacteria archaeon AArc-xg1-1]
MASDSDDERSIREARESRRGPITRALEGESVRRELGLEVGVWLVVVALAWIAALVFDGVTWRVSAGATATLLVGLLFWVVVGAESPSRRKKSR